MDEANLSLKVKYNVGSTLYALGGIHDFQLGNSGIAFHLFLLRKAVDSFNNPTSPRVLLHIQMLPPLGTKLVVHSINDGRE